MSDTIKIKLHVGTGFANCQHEDTLEIDKEVWEEMSEQERDDFLDEAAIDFRNNVIECGAWIIEGDE